MTGSIEKEYEQRAARSSAGVIVFSPEVAIEIIQEAQRRDIPTYGLDAFLLHPEGKVQPDMEYDLTLPGRQGDHDKVIAHLQRFLGTSYFFEVSTA